MQLRSLIAVAVVSLAGACSEPVDEAPAASCSCAGKPEGCYNLVTQVSENSTAYCAIWDGEDACCLTVSR